MHLARKVSFLFFLLACASFVFPSAAQYPLGAVRGQVRDPSGARIPSAGISIHNPETAIVRETRADTNGEFRLEGLLPGNYELTVVANGFADAQSEVIVAISDVRDVEIVLQPKSGRETITVQARSQSINSEPLDAASVVHQAIIYRQDLQGIPQAARSFANIAYLAPGTEPVEPSDPTKARITAVSTGGSSGLNNVISVDGGDNSDDYIGGFLQNFSPDAIQEFAVRTAQMDAETGGTTAGSVVILTRSGSNNWHGELGFYERASSLNARFPIDNPAPDPKQPFSRQNYVSTLGGPIVKDKLWFFTSLEYVHEDASIAFSKASVEQFNALSQLASEGLLPGVASIDVPSSVPVPFRDYLATLRVDWAQSDRSRWFLRGAIDTYTTHNALVQQGTLPSTGVTSHNNYFSLVLGQQFDFSPEWFGSLVLNASGLHLTQTRNEELGFAYSFPFTITPSTISGNETYGDNLFITAISAFPVLRNQQKYQLRYDLSHTAGRHTARFGVSFIHEPVLSGALTGTAERVYAPPQNPTIYVANPAQAALDLGCDPAAPQNQPPNPPCPYVSDTPAYDGSFSQNVQRLGLYAEDSWRVLPRLTLNYGLRYDTTFGLFVASGRDQRFNPALATGLVNGIPHDYRKAFAPRIGAAWMLGSSGNTLLRAGFGMFYDDLAQNGWVNAFTAVNSYNLANGTSPAALISPNYHTPYATQATAGIQHALSENWIIAADYTLETGMHAYRSYPFEQADLYRTDNRSTYQGVSVRVQGNVARRAHFTAHYTFSKAQTWGCTVGELFDYVNGVCDPNNPFGPGDYGPSGEDVRHRFVLAGTFQIPAGFQLSTLFQAESARPYTMTTPVGDRAVVNGVKTTLDEFRGSPYVQMDLRVSRPFYFRERWAIAPFAEFFNLFNRNNPGNNFIPDISALPVPVNDIANATALCPTPACAVPITSLSQLRAPAGALGDFFGPGTTVGIPFAAQLGVKLMF